MKSWFRKVVKCGLCKEKVRKKDTWQLNMKTAEGAHQVIVCNDCAKTMGEIKENIGTWLEQ
jgi:hypothetical protein